MKREDVKNYLKEHKWEIINAAIGGALIGISFYAGYQIAIKDVKGKLIITNKNLETLIEDASNKYDNGNGCMYSVIEPRFNMNDLGKLSEKMIKAGCTDNHKFTHFVMFGAKPE